MVFQLVLVRHGQSVYNEENKFTGWADIALTAEGFEEAKQVRMALDICLRQTARLPASSWYVYVAAIRLEDY